MIRLEKSPLVFQYTWELSNVEKKNMTILSRMIKFQDDKLFRVGLKNRLPSPTLFVVTANLNKVGVKAAAVTFNSGSDTTPNESMALQTRKEDDTESLQLFTAQLNSQVTGSRSFTFQIHVTGIVDGYQIQLMDGLLKEQLWSASKNLVGTDFTFVVRGKGYPAHKFVLAARSPVLAAQLLPALAPKFPLSRGPVPATRLENEKYRQKKWMDQASHEINFLEDGVGCMEQFLKFIYTGELLDGQIKSRDLLKLATTYQIKTLEDICKAALNDINGDQMVQLALQLKPEAEPPIVAIRTETDSKICCLSNATILDCVWNPTRWTDENKGSENSATSEPFEYQGGKLFRAQLWTRANTNRHQYSSLHYEFTLTLLRCPRDNSGFQLNEVTYTMKGDSYSCIGEKMQENSKGHSPYLQIFNNTKQFQSLLKLPVSITFHVKVSHTVSNFGYKLIDSTWKKQLWDSVINKTFTDVEFFVGDKCIISAHRSLLSARSPVFAAMFKSGMKEAQMGQVRLLEGVDPTTFRQFLEFLYTGTLPSSAKKEELFLLADKYQVETLMDLCRPATKSIDIEEYTKAFLSC